MEKVSIIVPIYNTDKKFLEECVNSILKQTYQEVEVILIDDGSCEEVAKKCDEFLLRDKRIFVYHRKNSGVSATRNFGLKKASGKWVFFMDSDDWLEKDAISQLVQVSNGMDIVLGRFFLDEIPFSKGYSKEKEISDNKKELIDGIFLDYHNHYSYVESVCAKLYLREFLEVNQIFFPVSIAIGEDAIFNLEAYQKAKKIKYLPVHIYHYRTNETSVMHTFDNQVVVKYEQLLKMMKEKINNLHLNELERQYHFFAIRQLHRLCNKYIFAKENLLEKKDKIEVLKTLMNQEIYRTAIQKINIKSLSPRRVLLVMGLRLHLYSFIGLLYSFN